MVTAALTKARLFERPRIDEPTPEWAHELIPLATEASKDCLGISRERVPRETIEELSYLSPLPEPSKRKRGGDAQKRSDKSYLRTSGLAVYLACLPFALAKQLDLFAGAHDGPPNEVAVLNIRKMADLARSVGISYDRLHRWMTILIALGFIWRFRDGKHTLYVIPLVAYFPRSATDIQEKLNGLIRNQFVEVRMEDGKTVCLNRNPSFTRLLLEVRTRFEVRYDLTPSLDLPRELASPHYSAILTEIRQRLPHLSAGDMTELAAILSKYRYAETAEKENRQTVESVPSEANIFLPDQGRGKDGLAGQEAALPIQNRGHNGNPTSSKNRFDRQNLITPEQNLGPSQASADLLDEEALGTLNLFLPSDDTLTLGLQKQETSSQKRETNDEAEQDKEQRCRELGVELARTFNDLNDLSLKSYISAFRTAKDERLVRAVFLKVLDQEHKGGFTKSAGAFFKYLWDRWKVYRTYSAACDKWNNWEGRDPQGIPPDIQDLVAHYSETESYIQIAIDRKHRFSMTGRAAEALEKEMRRYAGWYLEDPQICREPGPVPDSFVVKAWRRLDGQEEVFGIREEWMNFHQRMLTLPNKLNAWFEAERAVQAAQQQRSATKDDGMDEEGRAACVKVALAHAAYFGHDISSLSWKELVVLGKPLAFHLRAQDPVLFPKREEEENTLEPPQAHTDIRCEGDQIYVRLGEYEVPVDEYQHAFEKREGELWLDEAGTTVNGQLVSLLSKEYLGLNASRLMNRFGLETYKTLVCGFLSEKSDSEASLGQAGTREGIQIVDQAEDAPGMSFEDLCRNLAQLRSALDPHFYQVRWKRINPSVFCIVLFSQVSGQRHVYSHIWEVEQALLGLSTEEEEVAVG